jgi:hypothetical protein
MQRRAFHPVSIAAVAKSFLGLQTRLVSDCKHRADDLVVFHFVNAEHFNRSLAIRKIGIGARKISRDDFVITHHVAHRDALQELRMKIGFGETNCEAFAQFIVTFREQVATQIVMRNIVRVRCEQTI